MPVRPTMADLIARVRTLIDDADASEQELSDQTIQNFLDSPSHRDYADYTEALPVRSIAPGGTTEYKRFCHPLSWGDWEGGDQLTLTNNNYDPITADAGEDLLIGQWDFTVEPERPVFIKGWSYDVFGAAADCLDLIAVRLGADCDKCNHWRKMADNYRSQMRQRSGAETVEMVRTDVIPSRRNDYA